jgi:hypothetical protein
MNTNIKMIRGDTYSFSITVVNNNVPVNLTGGKLRMTAKWNYIDLDASALFALYSPASGIVFSNPSVGEATITIPSSSTSSLPAHEVRLPYDIQFTSSAGSVYTVMSGLLIVSPDVSITTS